MQIILELIASFFYYQKSPRETVIIFILSVFQNDMQIVRACVWAHN